MDTLGLRVPLSWYFSSWKLIFLCVNLHSCMRANPGFNKNCQLKGMCVWLQENTVYTWKRYCFIFATILAMKLGTFGSLWRKDKLCFLFLMNSADKLWYFMTCGRQKLLEWASPLKYSADWRALGASHSNTRWQVLSVLNHWFLSIMPRTMNTNRASLWCHISRLRGRAGQGLNTWLLICSTLLDKP